MLYQMVELEEFWAEVYRRNAAGEDVADYYAGSSANTGVLSVGFVATDQYEQLLREHKALQELLAAQDSELVGLRAELEKAWEEVDGG